MDLTTNPRRFRVIPSHGKGSITVETSEEAVEVARGQAMMNPGVQYNIWTVAMTVEANPDHGVVTTLLR